MAKNTYGSDKNKMAVQRGKLNQNEYGKRKVQMPQVAKTDEHSDLVQWMIKCRDEAKEAKEDRMQQNEENYQIYNLKHDFSHKNPGQSREVLAKQRMAVEQIATFFQQAMVDPAESFRADGMPGINTDNMRIRPNEISLITQRQLEKADWFSFVGRAVKSGLLGALPICKIHGCYVNSPKFRTEKDAKTKELVVVKDTEKHWQLKLTLVRQEDYYPDPTGNGLYEIEDMFMDFHEVLAMAERGIYDIEVVNQLPTTFQESDEDERRKNNETAQNPSGKGHRRRVKITEYWGNVIDCNTGKLIHENVVYTVANDKYVIRAPIPNPNWHQTSPYVAEPLIDPPHGVWPIAMMDAPTKHNMAATELYNLIVDGAMKAVHGINQIRPDWLMDPSQVENGIRWGANLKLNSLAPIGAKVLEDVSSGNVPADAVNILNIINQEFNSSALTNDLRQGVVPFRQVKATEIVEASQTISSVFQGITTNFENKFLVKVLNKAWQLAAQRMNDTYEPEMRALLGDLRWTKIAGLSPQKRFTETVGKVKFRVFGISKKLTKQQDFRKWMQLLQTIAQAPMLMELFVQRYDMAKLLEEIITALDVDKYRILRPEVEQQAEKMIEEEESKNQEQSAEQVQQQVELQNQYSQMNEAIGQTEQAGSGSLSDLFSTPEFPQTEFPESRATPSEGV